MASTILEAFCAVTPLLPQLMTQRVGMVVADREKWVAANSIEELAATVVVGKAVKPEAAVAVAMRERRRVVVQVKKEVYGVPYVAVSIPLEEAARSSAPSPCTSRSSISAPCTRRRRSCARRRKRSRRRSP